MTTLNSVNLFNPIGSASGQVPLSTGPNSPPVWGNLSYTNLINLPTPQREVFTAGTDFVAGTSTSITVAGSYGSVSSITIHFDGVYQSVSQLASLVGKVLTFTSPIPAAVTNIYLDSFSVPTVTSNPPASSVGVAQLAPDALAYFPKTAVLSGGGGAALLGYNQGAAGALTITQQQKNQQNVSVLDFAGVDPTGATDSTAGLQAAINSLMATGGVINVPSGTYLISSPLLLYAGISLVGANVNSTSIIKNTSTLGTGSAVSPSGYSAGSAGQDSYVVDSIISIIHSASTYTYNTQIRNITLKKNSYSGSSSYGVYAPRITHCTFDSVQIQNVAIGVLSYNSWMTHLRRVTCQAVNIGFSWVNDGSGNGSGTSTIFENCWVNFDNTVTQPLSGFSIFGLTYSSLISTGVDNGIQATGTTPVFAYSFNTCAGISLVGCGTENMNGTSIAVYTSSVDVSAFRASGFTGNVGTNTSAMVWADTNSSLTLSNCAFFPVTSASATYYNWVIQGGADVYEINPQYSPSGGSSFISYGGGAVKTSLNLGVTTVSNSSGNFVSGLAIDNTPIGQTTPAAVSGTSLSATTSFLLNPGVGSWNGNFKGLQIGNAAFAGNGLVPLVASNCYYNASNNPIYSTSAIASQYYQANGTHYFSNAVSGTAGNAVSFNTPYQLGPTSCILNVPVQVNHLVGGGGTPAIAAGAGAGTGATVSVTGTDTAMTVTLTTGTSPSASNLLIVTFNVPYGAAPRVGITPSNANSAALYGGQQVYLSATTTNALTLSVASTALAASTTYVWTFLVVQ